MADAAAPGLLASLRRLLGSAAEMAELRLALLATELQQEKLRLLEALAWLALAALATGVALVLLSVWLVMLVDERHRVLVLGLLALAYLAGAWLAWRTALARLVGRGEPFAATRAELRLDRDALRPAEPGPPP
jgi:uncharacterized membrane protein YqjE